MSTGGPWRLLDIDVSTQVENRPLADVVPITDALNQTVGMVAALLAGALLGSANKHEGRMKD